MPISAIKTLLLAATVVASAAPLAAIAPPAAAQTLAPGTYSVVADRSASLLRIKGPLGTISAEIPLYSGTIEVGPGGQIVASEAELNTAGVGSSNALALRQIRSPAGLDVERFPSGFFVATDAKVSGKAITLRGNLTIKSTTRPMTLTGEIVRANRRRFSAVFEGTIDRTKFGVTAGRPLYSRNATVRLRLVARKARGS